MSKKSQTLVVFYTPRYEQSSTKVLLDFFMKELETNGSEDVVTLDLLKDVPDFFTAERVAAYGKRNYGGQTLSPEEAKTMQTMDRMLEQFMAADKVVLAYPMYNFSMPALVKAYMDSILQKGKTFDYNETGQVGLMKGKKALVINTSAGIYTDELQNNWMDHSTTLAKYLFKYMGFAEAVSVSAGGMSQSPELKQQSLAQAKQELERIAGTW